MTPRTLIAVGVGLLVVMGCLVLALVVHAGTESKADGDAAPASSVTPLDALARALETPGADTPTGRLAARLPLERQVAQLFLVGFDGVDDSPPPSAPIVKREWGAILVRPSNTLDAPQV